MKTLPKSWVIKPLNIDDYTYVENYFIKKHNIIRATNFWVYLGEKDGNIFWTDNIHYYKYEGLEELTIEQFKEMIKEEEVWKKGDILYTQNSYIKIIEILGDVCFHTGSHINIKNIDESVVIVNTISNLRINRKLKLYKPEQEKEENILELTLEEIAEKFNVDVKHLKIKK